MVIIVYLIREVQRAKRNRSETKCTNPSDRICQWLCESEKSVMLQNSRHHWHLQAARTCLGQEQHGDALGHLVFLASVEPSTKDLFEEEFNTALGQWSDTLYTHGEIKKIVICLQQALKLYPESEGVLNNVGAILYKLGFNDEAASCFRKALQVSPDSVRAKENLENVANTLVERWHFRMLNDKQRNLAYKEAITRAIGEGYDIVLDIGSGSGILSMFAVQAGAKEVYACEMSKTMYEVSHDVLAANQMEDAVKLVNKKSTDIEVGTDIPKHVSLVVTETLDCGLLGEGILATVQHAWEYLLSPPVWNPSCDIRRNPDTKSRRSHCRVIPAGAVVHAVAITSEAIRNQSRSTRSVCGIDLSSLYLIGGEELECKTSLADSENCLDHVEPYTTECLKTLKNGYTPLTDTFQVAKYNFNEPESLASEGDLHFEVPVTQTGHLDAIAMWFELRLDDMTSISTGPESDSLCWEQAVFPVYLHHLKGENLKSKVQDNLVHISKGSTLVIRGRFTKEYLRLQCEDLKESTQEVQCSFASNCKISDSAQASSMDQSCLSVDSGVCCSSTESSSDLKLSPLGHVALVPPCYMKCLNDKAFNSACDRAITKAVEQVSSVPFNNKSVLTDTMNNQVGCRVLDITYGASLCGLFAARAGAGHVLICNPDISFALLERIQKKNALPSVVEYGPKKLEEAVHEGRMWDVLIADVVEPSGLIRQQVVEDIVFARGCLLKPHTGRVVPLSITVHCMCINSPFLFANSCVVSRDNTLGLDIGRFMNLFQVGTQVNVDLSTLNFTPITDQFELFRLDFMECVDDDQELLSLLETESEQRVTVKKSGRIQALPYWFTIHFDESSTLCTFSDSHWRQAVVIIENEFDVHEGEHVVVTASCKNSCISLKVKKVE